MKRQRFLLPPEWNVIGVLNSLLTVSSSREKGAHTLHTYWYTRGNVGEHRLLRKCIFRAPCSHDKMDWILVLCCGDPNGTLLFPVQRPMEILELQILQQRAFLSSTPAHLIDWVSEHELDSVSVVRSQMQLHSNDSVLYLSKSSATNLCRFQILIAHFMFSSLGYSLMNSRLLFGIWV